MRSGLAAVRGLLRASAGGGRQGYPTVVPGSAGGRASSSLCLAWAGLGWRPGARAVVVVQVVGDWALRGGGGTLLPHESRYCTVEVPTRGKGRASSSWRRGARGAKKGVRLVGWAWRVQRGKEVQYFVGRLPFSYTVPGPDQRRAH